MYIVIFSNQKTPSMNLSLVWVSLLCSLPIALFSQFTVEGALIDYQTGAPVAAVHVMIKGSTTGVVSDADGYFSLPSPQSPVHLIFTHPAYFTHEQQMQAGDSLSIELFGRHLRSVDTVMTFDPETYEEQVTVVYYDAFPAANHQPHNEDYAAIAENDDSRVAYHPVSTFSIDVDQASYSNVRRFIRNGIRPPVDAIRIEEMINYFPYNYPQPEGYEPFLAGAELAECPWNPDRQLLHVHLQARKIDLEKLPSSNLVFLIDVSGSMDEVNKLPLVKASLQMLARRLRPQDQVSMVVYAGAAGVVLPPTSGDQKQHILQAIESLEAGGSTAGGEGIELAYELAKKHFLPKGNNRVILATDGDFNVGPSNESDLLRLIEEKRKDNIFLTVLGFGMGNYKDDKLELLADHGNGNYGYIDNAIEAKKLLIHQMGGTLFTLAKDVKIQMEFNPAQVESYRLVGYENRLLNREDFENDEKDAGELGAGHAVTALYEIVPAASAPAITTGLRYQQSGLTEAARNSGELAILRVRYKQPEGEKPAEEFLRIAAVPMSLSETSTDFRFAAAVAGFGLILRESPFNQTLSYEHVLSLAGNVTGSDPLGLRTEFLELVKYCREMGWEPTGTAEQMNR